MTQRITVHSATKLDTFTVTVCDIFCFGYNMHVFTRAQSYFLNKLHDHWVYRENSYCSDFKQNTIRNTTTVKLKL